MSRGIRIRTLVTAVAVVSAATVAVVGTAAVGGTLRMELGATLAPERLAAVVAAVRATSVTVGLLAIVFVLAIGIGVGGLLESGLHALREAVLRFPGGPQPRSRVAEVAAAAAALERLGGDVERRIGHLRAERDELARMIGAVNEGILRLEPDGRIVRLNRAAHELLGLPESAVGERVASVLRNAELRTIFERAAGGTVVEPREVALDERRLLVAGWPLGDNGSRAVGGAAVVVMDMTELRRLEDVRRDFVANASHELKTPLTAIRGYTETLLDGDLPDDVRREFLGTVHANAERLQRIIDDLLDLSRLESGGWRPELQEVNLAAAAADAWGPFRDAAGHKGVEFTIETGTVRALADPGALRQIFSNLFGNALRHTPGGGRITVRATAAPTPRPGERANRLLRRMPGAPSSPREAAAGGDRVAVTVADTGSGIPQDEIPRIFERFYRVDPARSRAEGGTGLGLAIVRHLVESMGGAVSADSRLGRGTTIDFSLPAACAAESPVHAH